MSEAKPVRKFIICNPKIEQSFDGLKQTVRICLEQDFDVPIGGETIIAVPLLDLQESQERERLLTEALESVASENWPDHIIQDNSRASLQALIEWNMDVAAKALAKIRGTNG